MAKTDGSNEDLFTKLKVFLGDQVNKINDNIDNKTNTIQNSLDIIT